MLVAGGQALGEVERGAHADDAAVAGFDAEARRDGCDFGVQAQDAGDDVVEGADPERGVVYGEVLSFLGRCDAGGQGGLALGEAVFEGAPGAVGEGDDEDAVRFDVGLKGLVEAHGEGFRLAGAGGRLHNDERRGAGGKGSLHGVLQEGIGGLVAGWFGRHRGCRGWRVLRLLQLHVAVLSGVEQGWCPRLGYGVLGRFCCGVPPWVVGFRVRCRAGWRGGSACASCGCGR